MEMCPHLCLQNLSSWICLCRPTLSILFRCHIQGRINHMGNGAITQGPQIATGPRAQAKCVDGSHFTLTCCSPLHLLTVRQTARNPKWRQKLAMTRDKRRVALKITTQKWRRHEESFERKRQSKYCYCCVLWIIRCLYLKALDDCWSIE